MLRTIKQIGLDLAARFGLLGPSVFHADVRREFWGKVLHPDFVNNESASKRTVTSWMARRNARFPLRFVGYRVRDGFHRSPTFADLTIYGFETAVVDLGDPVLAMENGERPELIVNLLWSAPMFDDGAVQKMYWCNSKPGIPVL